MKEIIFKFRLPWAGGHNPKYLQEVYYNHDTRAIETNQSASVSTSTYFGAPTKESLADTYSTVQVCVSNRVNKFKFSNDAPFATIEVTELVCNGPNGCDILLQSLTPIAETVKDADDGQIIAVAYSTQGPVTFSLDDEDYVAADEVDENTYTKTFENLAPGEHTVYVTDANGCEGNKKTTVPEAVFYGERWRLEYYDHFGNTTRVRLFFKMYEGTVTEVCGADDPLMITWGSSGADKNEVYQASECQISLISTTNFQYLDLFTSDEKGCLVQIEKKGAEEEEEFELKWTGYVLPDFWTEQYVNTTNYAVSFSATDGLGHLNKKYFEYIFPEEEPGSAVIYDVYRRDITTKDGYLVENVLQYENVRLDTFYYAGLPDSDQVYELASQTGPFKLPKTEQSKAAMVYTNNTDNIDSNGTGTYVNELSVVAKIGTITVSDGQTNNNPYKVRGKQWLSEKDAIIYCLKQLGLSLPLYIGLNIFEARMEAGDDDCPMEQAHFLPEVFAEDGTPFTCYQVIEEILRSYLGCRIFQQNGAWWILNINELYQPFRWRKYDHEGTFVESGVTNPVMPITSPQPQDAAGLNHWINREQTLEILPAYRNVAIYQLYSPDPNILVDGEFSEKAFNEDNGLNYWTGTADYVPAQEIKINGRPPIGTVRRVSKSGQLTIETFDVPGVQINRAGTTYELTYIESLALPIIADGRQSLRISVDFWIYSGSRSRGLASDASLFMEVRIGNYFLNYEGEWQPSGTVYAVETVDDDIHYVTRNGVRGKNYTTVTEARYEAQKLKYVVMNPDSWLTWKNYKMESSEVIPQSGNLTVKFFQAIRELDNDIAEFAALTNVKIKNATIQILTEGEEPLEGTSYNSQIDPNYNETKDAYDILLGDLPTDDPNAELIYTGGKYILNEEPDYSESGVSFQRLYSYLGNAVLGGSGAHSGVDNYTALPPATQLFLWIGGVLTGPFAVRGFLNPSNDIILEKTFSGAEQMVEGRAFTEAEKGQAEKLTPTRTWYRKGRDELPDDARSLMKVNLANLTNNFHRPSWLLRGSIKSRMLSYGHTITDPFAGQRVFFSNGVTFNDKQAIWSGEWVELVYGTPIGSDDDKDSDNTDSLPPKIKGYWLNRDGSRRLNEDETYRTTEAGLSEWPS